MVLLLYMSMAFYVVAILIYTCLRYFPSMSDVTPKYVRCNSQVSLNKLTNEMRNKWEKLRSEKEIIAYVVVMLS